MALRSTKQSFSTVLMVKIQFHSQILTYFCIFLAISRYHRCFQKAYTGAQKSKKLKITKNELKHTQTIREGHKKRYHV